MLSVAKAQTAEVKSVCRICIGTCGTRLTVENGKVTSIRGDKSHPLSRGYACIKGLNAHNAMHSPERILNPLKRNGDGGWDVIPLEQALDEIAERMARIIAEDGPESAALFKGTQAYLNVTAAPMLEHFQQAIGSPSFFTTMTIDQSAKFVGYNRIGMWGAPQHHFHDSDVVMLVGANPLVSLSVQGVIPFNMTKQFQDARARGMKLIVVDPRATETAKLADVHLQVRPGEDASLMAGILHEILRNDWQDTAFCDRYVTQLHELQATLRPFDLEYVSARAGVPATLITQAARAFALESQKGCAYSSTGPNMAMHSNLAEHLIQVINIVCGRFMREGEVLRNPGVLNPLSTTPPFAGVIPPMRQFETGPKSRVRGIGAMFGEMMSATLPEEVLIPGKGRIRSLIVTGANPAVSMPDQIKTIEALKALDLLTVVEPFHTATTEFAHYVLPPKMLYEREDVLMTPAYEGMFMPVPHQRLCQPVVLPPEGSEVCDEWRIYYGLARRLGVQIVFDGIALDMTNEPQTRDILSIVMRRSPITVEELATFPEGKYFEGLTPVAVAPANSDARFELMPSDVQVDMDNLAAEPFAATDEKFPFRLISRRMRETQNSFGRAFPGVRERVRFNPAFMHPEDMARMGLSDGDRVSISSDTGTIEGRVKPEAELRPGVISMAHCWGGIPGKDRPYDEEGSNTARLVSLDRDCEAINHMPRMTGIPVSITRLEVLSS